MDIVGLILGKLFSSFAVPLVEWWKSVAAQKTAQSNEWASLSRQHMLDSIKEADKVGVQIKDAKAADVSKPSLWNAGCPYLLLVAVFCQGCWSMPVYKEAKMPLIEAPSRPVVATQPAQWTDREQTLAQYAAKLESLIREYNANAQRQNLSHGY